MIPGRRGVKHHFMASFSEQVGATIDGDTFALDDYACQPIRYGVTTIPAYVTSTFRFQVFSYFNVAASYTSISNPAP